MTGWRLEFILATLAVVGLLFVAVAGDPDLWTIIYSVAAVLIGSGLLCAKWASIRAREATPLTVWPLAVAAALLLTAGTTLTGLILSEPPPSDNGGHNR